MRACLRVLLAPQACGWRDAVECPFVGAPGDRGQLEQVDGEVEIPVRYGVQAAQLAVAAHLLRFVGDPQAAVVRLFPVDGTLVQVVDQPVVGQVAVPVAQRAEFPVQHRHHPRLNRVDGQIARSQPYRPPASISSGRS